MSLHRRERNRRLALVVFLASAALLVGLEWVRARTIDAPAVAVAPSARVLSPVAGRVTSVLVTEGQWVRAGQELATIRSDDPDDSDEASVLAPRDGVVLGLVAAGQPVLAAVEVARIGAERASELVAYLPATRSGVEVRAGSASVSTERGVTCRAEVYEAQGAPIEPVPEQLRSSAGMSHGAPVRARLGEECRLAAGQVVEVALSLSGAD